MSALSPLPSPGSTNPADGTPLPPVPTASAEDVRAAVATSRAAQAAWAALTLAERARRVKRLALRMLDDAVAIGDIIAQETGRSPTAARFPEVAILGDYVNGAIGVAKRALRPRKVRLDRLALPGKRGVIELVPRGVIGVITPWNYPLMQVYKPLFPALLAGNGVVIKPSEHTPRTAAWVGRMCDEILPAGLVQVVHGDGAVGAALVDAGVDAVTFTGSVRTGRKVAAACGERLIPCSTELGGKDAAIVLADCNLDRTLAGIAYAAMHNAGMDCASIERVIVEEAIADAFVERLGRAVAKLRVGNATSCEIGPLQNAAQLAIVEDHVADALARGAVVVTGGQRTGAGLGYMPTVLDRCTPDMKVVREETFGPVVAVQRAAHAEEALDLANDSDYGLNGSVWTSDLARGERLARQLNVGVAHVNGHAWTGSQPHIPWTGVKGTGSGIVGSEFAYATFARPRTVMVDRNKNPEAFWFPFDADMERFALAVVEKGKGSLGALITLITLLGKRVKTVAGLVRDGG